MSKKTTRRENGYGTLTQNKNGSWRIRVLHGTNPSTGKRRFISATGATKSQARQNLMKRIQELETQGALPVTQTPTFNDYTKYWLTVIQKRVKPRVWESYKGECAQFTRLIGAVKLSDITSRHIEFALSELSHTRSSSTIHNYYIRIRQILNYAMRDKLITSNPAQQMQPPRCEREDTIILDTGQPRLAINAVNHVTIANSALALASVDEKEMWQLMFTLAFATGMRQAERFGLTPSELETRNGVHGIVIQHQLQYLRKGQFIPHWLHVRHVTGNYYLLPPKTKQGKRFIPVSNDLWIKLNQLAQKNCRRQTDLIFTLNKKPLNAAQERRRWKQALATAGLPYTTIRAARHFFSTQLAENGAPEDARIAIMGHAKITTTATYTHWTPQALAEYSSLANQALATAKVGIN